MKFAAFDRKVVETTIARNAAEKKLVQLEATQQALEHQVKELEQARTALVERNGALTKSLRNRETALARAEEKIVLSTETIARLEAEAQTNRDRENKRVEEIMALLERERMERALSEGALEAARKENARLQRENAAIDAKRPPGGDLAKRTRAAGKGDVHPIVKG